MKSVNMNWFILSIPFLYFFFKHIHAIDQWFSLDPLFYLLLLFLFVIVFILLIYGNNFVALNFISQSHSCVKGDIYIKFGQNFIFSVIIPSCKWFFSFQDRVRNSCKCSEINVCWKSWSRTNREKNSTKRRPNMTVPMTDKWFCHIRPKT